MNKRTCQGCRFWHQSESADQNGQCRRYPPAVIMPHGLVRPTMAADNSCGEWRDKSITPEQEQRAELVEQFALAIVKCDDNAFRIRLGPAVVWKLATDYADAKPKIGGES